MDRITLKEYFTYTGVVIAMRELKRQNGTLKRAMDEGGGGGTPEMRYKIRRESILSKPHLVDNPHGMRTWECWI